MQELTAPARFLFWIVTVIAVLGLFGFMGKATHQMAEAAIEAQSHQMSWGKVSRQLWSNSTKK